MPSALFARFRRYSATQWASRNPVLKDAEPGWDSTNKTLKIGDGITAWLSLAAFGTGTGGTTVPATTTVQGIVELATSAEGIAGTDTVRAMTPKAVADTIAAVSPTIPDATSSTKGKVQLATTTEATTGTDTAKAVTAAGVKAVRDALVNGAPTGMDTLKEISDSLGGDTAYATTTTTALAGKSATPITGCYVTWTFEYTDYTIARPSVPTYVSLDWIGPAGTGGVPPTNMAVHDTWDVQS